jgi:transposase-like protein
VGVVESEGASLVRWVTAATLAGLAAVIAQWPRVADQLRPKVPRLAALMDETETDGLAYMTFPPQHRAKLHSTNPLEEVSCAAARAARLLRRRDREGIRHEYPMPGPR